MLKVRLEEHGASFRAAHTTTCPGAAQLPVPMHPTQQATAPLAEPLWHDAEAQLINVKKSRPRRLLALCSCKRATAAALLLFIIFFPIVYWAVVPAIVPPLLG